MYKLYIFCPDDKKLINKLVNAASKAGAGIMGKYSHCAFIQPGTGTWKSEKGSKPHIGKVGKVSRVKEVKIEMECPKNKAKSVQNAIRKVHPYEKVIVDFLRLEKV